MLALYDPTACTEVHTDAAQLGLGGILSQKGVDGLIHPCAYVSRQTTPDEQKYHSGELETLCVVWTLDKLRTYLIGIQFTIVTDCNSLRTTFVKNNLIPRIGRWWMKLLNYKFDVVHRPGKNMAHVDALSRNPVPEPEETEAADGLEVMLNTVDFDEWLIIRRTKIRSWWG